jgi:hypothetical protein
MPANARDSHKPLPCRNVPQDMTDNNTVSCSSEKTKGSDLQLLLLSLLGRTGLNLRLLRITQLLWIKSDMDAGFIDSISGHQSYCKSYG